MLWWNMKHLLTPDGRSRILEWREAHDDLVQAAFDTRLDYLSLQRDWFTDPKRAGVKKLLKRHAGLVEIILEVPRPPRSRGDKLIREHHRPLGFFAHEPDDRAPGTFVLVAGCMKTGSCGTHTLVFDEALVLLRRYREGEGEIHDLIL